jgi:hypothetical protein
MKNLIKISVLALTISGGAIFAQNGFTCSASAECGEATVSCTTDAEGAECTGADEVGVRCGDTYASCGKVEPEHLERH